ncbi:MAG: amidase family protein, partial [Gemmatimonadota bacterium]
AFPVGEKAEDPLAMYLNDVYTVSANLAGIPAVSVPFGRVAPTPERPALPIGVQLMGPARAERRLFELARFLEREAAP